MKTMDESFPKRDTGKLERGIWIVVLIIFGWITYLFSAQSTVTYSTRTQLGDGLFYTFTWTNAAATDSAYVLGRDGEGFLAVNMNDRQVTIEISSTEATADSVDWYVDLLGNHEESSTVADWFVLTTDSLQGKIENQLTFTSAQMGNNLYIGFVFRGTTSGGNENAASQTITCRVMWDYDGIYVGKER